MQGDGIRVLQPLPDAASWFPCFDIIQVNEDEMNQLGPDPLSLAAGMLGAGVSTLIVTLGPRGAIYVTDGGSGPVRTALVSTSAMLGDTDPTGCGDVFGAAACARLLAGDSLEQAVAAANRAAARNVTFRGATGLAQHLRGELVVP
jgi:sugar/nucleoside kinase (ribokinase family)